MKRPSWDYKLCPILVLMLEGETAAMYLLFSICGGCAAGKKQSPGVALLVWYTPCAGSPGKGLVVCSVQLPSSQPHRTVAKSLIIGCVRPDFVHLSISCLDTPCGSAEYSD